MLSEAAAAIAEVLCAARQLNIGTWGFPNYVFLLTSTLYLLQVSRHLDLFQGAQRTPGPENRQMRCLENGQHPSPGVSVPRCAELSKRPGHTLGHGPHGELVAAILWDEGCQMVSEVRQYGSENPQILFSHIEGLLLQLGLAEGRKKATMHKESHPLEPSKGAQAPFLTTH